MAEHIGADEARRLLDAATAGPWGPLSFRGTGLGWDVEGPEVGIRGQFDSEADATLAAAAPRLAAEVVRLNELLNELPDHNHRDCCLNDLRHAAAGGGVPEEGATDE